MLGEMIMERIFSVNSIVEFLVNAGNDFLLPFIHNPDSEPVVLCDTGARPFCTLVSCVRPPENWATELDLTLRGDLARKLLLLTALAEADPLQQRAGHGLEHDVGLGPGKVDEAHPRLVSLILGRAHDAVHRALEVPAAEELERVGDVDDDGVARAPDVPPPAVGHLDLEPRDGLVEQERQGVVVGVAAGPDVAPLGVVGARPRVVLHVAQVLETLGVVAVAARKEVVVAELEGGGEEAQEGQQQRVVDAAREGPDLVPVVEDGPRVGAAPDVLGRELGEVVALVVVAAGEGARGLGLIAAEVARGRVALVPQLLGEGQVEDGAADGVLPADLGVAEAVAYDVEKA